MRNLMFAGIAASALIGGGASAGIVHGVVPPEYENANGTSTFLYMVTTGRTYQMQIHESELTQFVGLQLTGLTWRLPASATTPWPPSDAVFNNFDIYLGPGVTPADRSSVFADNFTGSVTQVRSGPLTMPTGSFSSGGSPNDWGFEISFSNYVYTGGHLTVEIRHDGMTGNTTTRSFDALNSSTPGYLTRFSALWTGSYDGVTGAQGNFFVTRFTAVPGPGALAVLGLGLVALRGRRRKA